MARGLSDRELLLTDFDKLSKDNKRLKIDNNFLIREQNKQSAKLSDLASEEIKINANNDKLISDAKVKADGIIAKAKERESKIANLEAELKGKIAKAEEAEKQSNNLIKSNQGKEKNLLTEKEIVAEMKDKLAEIMGMIKDVI